MKRKIISVVLSVSMLASLGACSKDQPTESETTTEPVASDSSETTEETEESEETSSETSSETEATEESTSLMGFNMIDNGDFSSGDIAWGTYFEGGGDGSLAVVDGVLQFDISNIGTLDYSNQLYYDGFRLYEGCTYEMQFDAWSSADRPVEYRIQINGGDYHAYTSEIVATSTESQHFDIVFTMGEASDPAPRLCFNCGVAEGIEDIGAHSIYFDNFDLQCIDESGLVESSGDDSSSLISINQVGYLPDSAKVAVMHGDAISSDATVIDAASGEVVYEGAVEAASYNDATGRDEARFDFSSVTEAGVYKVVSGEYESYEFTIASDVYNAAFDSSVFMLYTQRCGCELPEEFVGPYAHPVCHSEMAVIYGTSETIDVSGGWHDAGDYGRYVVPGAKTVADLLLSYENYQDAFSDSLGIPESGNGIADVLDEARYELEWMFKMQNAEGGVYHKVTCANFPGTVMPQDETDQLIVCPVSTTATADFAAVMAMASRIYADIDPDFAARCLDASVAAINYIQSHDSIEGGVNPSDIYTGEYPDTVCSDEIMWAAAELYRATGDTAYDELFSQYTYTEVATLGWQSVQGYAFYAYLKCENHGSLYDQVSDDFKSTIEAIMANAEEDSYYSSLYEYNWGSNLTVANNGILFLMYDDIYGSTDGATYALAQLNYLLGTNGTGYSFMTGYGTLCAENPHHRPSQAVGTAVSGMIVGGPNEGLDDPYAANVCAGNAPALCYADSDQSYSMNEVAIYWNSPVIYLFAYASTQG